MSTPKVYVLCDQNCRWEGMTKEQILAAITQAVESHEITDVDTGFVTTIKTINGVGLKFFIGTQAAWAELSADEKDGVFAIFSDDNTGDALKKDIEDLQADLATILDGTQAVQKAREADHAANAATADFADEANWAEFCDYTDFSRGTWETIDDATHVLAKNAFYYVKFTYDNWIYTGLIYTYCPDGELTLYNAGTFTGRASETGGTNFIRLYAQNGRQLADGTCYLMGDINTEYNLWDNVSSMQVFRIR